MNYQNPPKNVFNIPDLCPKCGGMGFVRGSGGYYDYQPCPGKCNNGKLRKEPDATNPKPTNS